MYRGDITISKLLLGLALGELKMETVDCQYYYSNEERELVINNVVSGYFLSNFPQMYLHNQDGICYIYDFEQIIKIILEYMSDKFALSQVVIKNNQSNLELWAYNVKFSQLPLEMQKNIWEYPLYFFVLNSSDDIKHLLQGQCDL